MNKNRNLRDEVRSTRANVETPVAKYDMEHQLSTYIPPHVRREGFTYKWERHSLRGQVDPALSNSLRQHWKAVPIDRYPEFNANNLGKYFHKENSLASEYIANHELIYMERENELCEQEMRHNNKLAIQRLEDNNSYNFKN
jgi:hypothetical protein